MTNPYAAPDAASDGLPAAGGAITGVMLDALRGTKGWVKLVGILMFIGAAFTVIAALAMTLGGAAMRGMGGGAGAAQLGMMVGMAGFYLLMAAIYVFLGLHLVRYAGAINRLLADGDGESMEDALQHQQKFWRLAGIMVLIGMGFAIIGMVAAIAIPMMMR
ncbi:MAG TPA: DUF5362 family protein [Usitatibacteraceae bacterium]